MLLTSLAIAWVTSRIFAVGCVAIIVLLAGVWLGDRSSDNFANVDLAPLFEQGTVLLWGQAGQVLTL